MDTDIKIGCILQTINATPEEVEKAYEESETEDESDKVSVS